MDLPNIPTGCYDPAMSKLPFVVAGIIATLALAGDPNTPVPYPEGYRQWNHLHTTILAAKHGSFGKEGCQSPCTSGVMHFYANKKAMEGFRTGTFPDGAIIADEVLEIHQPEGKMSGTEGPRRGIGVMVKDRKKYASTGGWGYGAYGPDSKTDRLSLAERTACFTCHSPKKDRDYVFTEYKER
jgi:hypothetical protein